MYCDVFLFCCFSRVRPARPLLSLPHAVVVTRRQRRVVVVHDVERGRPDAVVSVVAAAAAGVAAAVVVVHDAVAYYAGGHGVFPQRGQVPRRPVREEGLPLRRRLRLSRPQ